MKKKILVIEDNPMVVKSLEFKLNKDGFDVTTSPDGRDGLEKIKAESFDLILTDLMLPFISGTQVIEQARTLAPGVPIIVLSTSNQEAIITNAFSMGVSDFMTKPFSPNELSLRVKRTLGTL